MRILIVNPFGIGDVLLSTPLVRALRRAFPDCYLAYLCNARTEPILRGNPHLNALFVYEKDEVVQMWRASKWRGLAFLAGFIGRIRRGRFDVMVDLSLGERYAFILALLGVRRRIGFDYHRRGRFLTERLPIDGYHEDHVVEYYRRFLRFIGISLEDVSLELHVSEGAKRLAQEWLRAHHLDGERILVGLVPAGGRSWGVDASFRRWNLEGFAAVGDALGGRYGSHVILFGEPADGPTCQAVAQHMRYPVMDLSGQTTLEQFVALLGCLDLVICNDGGPLHLAVSQQVRTVSIFGPVDPQVYGPHPQHAARHRVMYQPQLLCRPCYHQFQLPPCPYERACLTTIEPDDVVEACTSLLTARTSA